MTGHRKPKVDKRGRVSAGILLWRCHEDVLEVLLGHPGSPYFAGKDEGHWTVCKGEIDEPGEDLRSVAHREFAEETGYPVPADAELLPLGEIRQRSGKTVVAWAVEGDLDPANATSNAFEMEWPPRSGTVQRFPEIDRVAWFEIPQARVKLKPAQTPFLDRMVEALAAPQDPEVR